VAPGRCCCHATQQDGVLPGRSNRQQSPAGPVSMRRSRTPVAYRLGRQSKLWVKIRAVYSGSCKPQSYQKQKNNYSAVSHLRKRVALPILLGYIIVFSLTHTTIEVGYLQPLIDYNSDSDSDDQRMPKQMDRNGVHVQDNHWLNLDQHFTGCSLPLIPVYRNPQNQKRIFNNFHIKYSKRSNSSKSLKRFLNLHV